MVNQNIFETRRLTGRLKSDPLLLIVFLIIKKKSRTAQPFFKPHQSSRNNSEKLRIAHLKSNFKGLIAGLNSGEVAARKAIVVDHSRRRRDPERRYCNVGEKCRGKLPPTQLINHQILTVFF